MATAQAGGYALASLNANASVIVAGGAYDVYLVGADGRETPVNAATHEFRTGERFKVYFRPSLPGRLDVYNINPLGRETRIDSAETPAGQLTTLGAYEFTATKGDEALRFVLSPCSNLQLLASTRDIVNVSTTAGTSYSTDPSAAYSAGNTGYSTGTGASYPGATTTYPAGPSNSAPTTPYSTGGGYPAGTTTYPAGTGTGYPAGTAGTTPSYPANPSYTYPSAQPTNAFTLGSCTSLTTRSVGRVNTRDIVKVGVDGTTSFALDPVSQAELTSGQLTPREFTIYFRHR
jgi:hypothetical protein